jgi:hypothetical protein
MNLLALIPVMILVQASYFDMQGTVTSVTSPSELLVDGKVIKLEGVDASVLSYEQYSFLMNDLPSWLSGKDVFVKGSSVYFDLQGSYNSESINEMIQKEILNIKETYPKYRYSQEIFVDRLYR